MLDDNNRWVWALQEGTESMGWVGDESMDLVGWSGTGCTVKDSVRAESATLGTVEYSVVASSSLASRQIRPIRWLTR